MNKILALAVLSTLVAACSSTPTTTDVPVTDRTAAKPPTSSTVPSSSTTPSTTSSIAANPLKDPSNILSKRSVYFDFDSNAVKDEFRGLVQAHSKFMTDKRETKIRIEGNCDERGSREYNLALGQRRAESVKKVMAVLGVSDARVETVSYGEEKPAAPGHDESAWAQNRRADIKYAGE